MMLGVMMMTGCNENVKNNEGSSSAAETTVTTTTEAVRLKEPSEYGKVIALTFDDGPSVFTTSQVLDALEKYDVKASFFLVGNNISEGTADIVRRAYGMGCEINSHSRTHSNMKELTAEQIKEEMDHTSDKIEEIIGVKPKFFRPPYIAVNQTMYDNIELPFISGYGCNDWEDSVTAEQRAERVLAQAKDGAIILMHDMQGNDRTVEALDTIIPKLLEQGYEFVTVSELFYAKEVTPKSDGIVYSYAEQTTEY